jgi:hypothetical protein
MFDPNRAALRSVDSVTHISRQSSGVDTMFYHQITFWRSARNATGCVRVNQIIGSTATTIDEAAAERCRIAKQYKPGQIVALTTHNKIQNGVS